ncbi:uncharacterized protein LOC111371104 [Olea europaea var. sylvestris]|uniref:uncharacterized protein LOC111371104 n=1 Tax=Olea europaea var. sylvestris TaxID=158386 RepID=UPI000C1CDFDD|nr:uncharacterized protein LOC111371104 [Olea europaea var. sylvestris]
MSSREPSFSSISGWTTPISDDWNVTISGRSTPISDDRNVQLGSSTSSTVNETDWEGLLPPDYRDIISRSVNPVVYATVEDLFTGLCSSPILLDGGKMWYQSVELGQDTWIFEGGLDLQQILLQICFKLASCF